MNYKKLLLVCSIVAITLCVFANHVVADDDLSDGLTTNKIISLIEGFEDEEQFASQHAARALTIHLTAVGHYEQQGITDKVLEHMNSFKVLLNHQLEQQLVTESAYQTLIVHSDALIQQWDDLVIVQDGQANAVIIVPEANEPLVDNQIPGWRSAYRAAGKVRVVDTYSYSGDYSLHIDDDDSWNYGVESELIKIEGGKEYTASVMTMTDSESGSAATMFIHYYDENRKSLQRLNSWRSIGTEWVEFTFSSTAPAEAEYVSITLFSDTIGIRSLYFDDIVLEGAEGESYTIPNANFEQQYIANDDASTLVEYVQKSTGVELPVITESGLEDGGFTFYNRIYIGESAPGADTQIQELLDDMQGDGFVIYPHNNTVSIVGPEAVGTEFGVYDFLERYVGIRWLMPGENGEDVPLQQSIEIAREIIQEEPATIYRQLYGTTTPAAHVKWARYNRMYAELVSHGHNLWRIFPIEKYGESHPQLYPGGEPPQQGQQAAWQPCFTAEGSVDVAVQEILAYFADNPDAKTFSLGVNDSGGHCEADPNHPDYPNKHNSNGFVDISEIYYKWVNDVVEQVLDVYPDKWFGLLAYRNVIDPPSFPLNSRVIPFITHDRLSWIDPAIGEPGKQLHERWVQAAENIGWYEYMYGSVYNIPRIYVSQMAENYQYAQEHNVIAHFAELQPNWGEGPKNWISTRLQWDANQDVELLKGEWYNRAVGEKAAPYLSQYYDLWEQIWTERMFDSDWYNRWANSSNRLEYMNFNTDFSYMREITKEDIAESRRLLELVVANAVTDQQLKRAELLLRGFEFYEASALSYPLTEEIEIPEDEHSALELLDEVILSVEMAEKRVQLIREFQTNPSDPILHLDSYGGSPRGVWDGVKREHIEAIERYVETEPEGGVVGERLQQFLKDIAYLDLSAKAIKTTASKDEILQSLDFSTGPWTYAEPFNDFLVMNQKNKPPVETNVYLLWDDENLYVGYENLDDDPSQMIVSDDAPDAWWSSGGDDSVETYITDNPNRTFLGFFTNPKGVKFSRDDREVDWEARSWIGDDRWNTVQVIPFSSMGIDINMTHELQGFFFRNYHGHSVYIGWGGGAPWSPESFNPIQLVEHSGDDQMWASAENGKIRVRLNTTEEPLIEDFEVEQIINNGEPTSLVPVLEEWNAETKTAVLSVSKVPMSESDQSVVYHIRYQDNEVIRTGAFTIHGALFLVENGEGRAVVVVPEVIDRNIPGWRPPSTRVNGKVKIVNNMSYSGNHSLHIYDDDEWNYGAESELVEIVGGKTYTASAMVYVESGPLPVIRIFYYDKDRKLIAPSAALGGVVGEWRQITTTMEAPADAVYASVVLFSDTIGLRNFYMDDVELKQANGHSIPLRNAGFEETFHSAASTFAEYVEKASGVTLPVVENDEAHDPDLTRVYIGGFLPTGDAAIDEELGQLEEDRFIIQVAEALTIIGPSVNGTVHGVLDFLERYMGVIWEDQDTGEEYVPQTNTIAIPRS